MKFAILKIESDVKSELMRKLFINFVFYVGVCMVLLWCYFLNLPGLTFKNPNLGMITYYLNHYNFFHLFSNIFILLFSGFMLSFYIGKKRAIILLITGSVISGLITFIFVNLTLIYNPYNHDISSSVMVGISGGNMVIVAYLMMKNGKRNFSFFALKNFISIICIIIILISTLGDFYLYFLYHDGFENIPKWLYFFKHTLTGGYGGNPALVHFFGVIIGFFLYFFDKFLGKINENTNRNVNEIRLKILKKSFPLEEPILGGFL